DYADRESDLHYLVARLRLSDLFEFSHSYHNWRLKWEAFRGILVKGYIYKRDFEEFMLHPAARLEYVKQSRRDSHRWFYDYVGSPDSLKDVSIDFAAHTIAAPPSISADRKHELQTRFLDPLPPYMGRESAYLHYWLGKICEMYRGSRTQLVFLRLP